MTKKTKELLLRLKAVGYEQVTIFVHDKRVPSSVYVRKMSTGWGADEDGMFEIPDTEGEMRFAPKGVNSYNGTWWGLGNPVGIPFKVISADPPQTGYYTDSGRKTWPNIKGVMEEMSLGGSVHSESHSIKKSLCGLFTPGYYDLAEISETLT